MDERPGSNTIWRRGPPAAFDALSGLAARYPRLPAAYLTFLTAEDGSEGDLGVVPGWVRLWPAAQIIALNADYDIAGRLPGFLGFGSNASGELFAFDTRNDPWRVCMVPFVPLDEKDAVEVAPDFESFARHFGRPFS